MFTATRPAVEGIARPTNVIANCNAVRRPNGIGMGDMPERATALETRPMHEMQNATIRIGRLACWIASTMVSMPMSMSPEIKTLPAMNRSTTVNNPPSVTRRSFCRSR